MGKQVRALVTDEFDKVLEDEPILEAVKKIATSRKTTIACVVAGDGKLKGLLTPRDILEAVEVREYGTIRGRFFAGPEVLHLLTSQYAKDIMSAPLSVHVDDTVEEVISTMLDHGLYELPVIDEALKVIGGISYFDIIIDVLESYKT